MNRFLKIICLLIVFQFSNHLIAQKFEWAKNIGGESTNGKTYVYSITTDEKENVFVTGTFEGAVDFDPSEKENILTTAQPSPDIFILKLNSEGNFVWAKQISGLLYKNCLGIKIDKEQNIFIAGYFTKNVDFDPGPGVFELIGDDFDVFVTKLNSDGNFVWAKKMGGNASDICNSISLDDKGNIYLSGCFNGTAHFGINEKLISLVSKGIDDVFICKINPAGDFEWAKSFGGKSVDQSYSMTLDKNANVYVIGYFYEKTDFEGVNEKYEIDSYGGSDVFVTKLSTEGKYLWTRRLGSALDDFGRGIVVDSKDNILITGSFRNKMQIIQDKKKFELYATTTIDAGFICKLDAEGKFIWTKNIGYIYRVDAYGIATDDKDAIYTVGTFSSSTDFNPSEKSDTLTSAGAGDVYICKLNSKGDYEWAKSFGGVENELGSAINVSSIGNIFVSGTFTGKADFDPAKTEYFLNSKSSSAVYIVKLSGKK